MRRECMGFIFQEYNLVDSLTVLGNVELATRMAGLGRRRDVVLSMLEQVGMSNLSDVYPDELSGGQQQRVAIARALAMNPPIIFADEPTGALDAHNTSVVMQGLHELASRGSAIVIVTHDPGVAEEADRRLRIDSSQLIVEA